MARAIHLDGGARAGVAGRGLIDRMMRALEQRKQYARTVAELSQLSDRDLDDLGVHRADIHAIARESVYGA
jgi:uncharacterized protein YjiS (DUF1127 family)